MASYVLNLFLTVSAVKPVILTFIGDKHSWNIPQAALTVFLFKIRRSWQKTFRQIRLLFKLLGLITKSIKQAEQKTQHFFIGLASYPMGEKFDFIKIAIGFRLHLIG